MEFIVIYCTVPDKKEGREIAKVLVEDGLAACVNIIDKIDSVFFWYNQLCEEHEAMLMIKTRKIFFEQIRVIIKKIHSYNIPEIIALPITEADATYLKWIAHETNE